MATSHDYSELYWAWNAWRAEVGAPAREDYTRYVELKNQAAIANGKDLRKKNRDKNIIMTSKSW